ncbi:MAG: RluA family pseudouridine synthase [Candidatus Vogelbacteria bacterium]|nr:RluA family pseudouridine synthase [Candidatus Vogelbacteria bacterium]
MFNFMDIPILYEDENILALNKPAGVAVHKDGYNSEEETVADWVLAKYPALVEVGEPMTAQNGTVIAKPGIVHRLDKDTSGVLLVAKNQSTYLALKKQFQEHSIKKIYRLLVYGSFSADKMEGTIDLSIGRSRKDSRRRLAGKGASSVLREAVTNYRVLENFAEHAYAEARPETGRTHQIRVHFKAINHPIVCDSLYAPQMTCLPGLERQALHAMSIEFSLLGKSIRLEASLPTDFQTALASLKTL